MVQVVDDVLVPRYFFQNFAARSKQRWPGRVYTEVIMHDPNGKEIVLGVGGQPDGGDAATADLFPQPVFAKFPVFLDCDADSSSCRWRGAILRRRVLTGSILTQTLI
jgi:hypothetical protein